MAHRRGFLKTPMHENTRPNGQKRSWPPMKESKYARIEHINPNIPIMLDCFSFAGGWGAEACA